MKNMNKSEGIQFENDKDQEEYVHVSRFFTIAERRTPSPFFPERDTLLPEKKLFKHIKNYGNTNGLSLYIHIPFCDRKCLFCDLYSFKLPRNNLKDMDTYTRALEQEIQRWGELYHFAAIPVTTIHFGGGSPLVLPSENLHSIIRTLKKYFFITDSSEIAIEITSSQITNVNILLLKQLSFSRIHIGVQTLSDPIRKLIGRREPRAIVKDKLKKIADEDFIVSVDILYGLPLQTLQEFVIDVHELIETGLDGFALYELHISPGMRALIKKNPAYHISKFLSYQMFIQAKKILNNAGYRTVFFNHFGNNRDKNLYFTYLSRGEDCLAFGTIADARLETVFFRHMKYKKYIDAISKGGLGIDYGYREDAQRTLIRKFETCLMSGFIPESEINHMQQTFGYSFKGIFDLWRVAKLIVPCQRRGNYELTGSGCWLVSTMMEHIRDIG